MKTTKLRTRAVTKAFKETTKHLSPNARTFVATGLKFHRKIEGMGRSDYYNKILKKRTRNRLIKLGSMSRKLSRATKS